MRRTRSYPVALLAAVLALVPSLPEAAPGPPIRQALAGVSSGGPVTVLFSAEMLGYTEPCGCTAELQEGGIGRLAAAVERARSESSYLVLLDGGDLLTGELPIPEGREAQEQARGTVLLRTAAALHYEALVPGEIDLGAMHGLKPLAKAAQTKGLHLLVSNLRSGAASGPGTEGLLLLQAGSLRLGLLAFIDPELLFGARAGGVADLEPLTASLVAARVAALRAAGATHVVVIGHAPRRKARKILGEVRGIDFWLVAHGSQDTAEAEPAGDARLLEVWTQGRRLGRLDLYPDTTSPRRRFVASRREDAGNEEATLQRRLAYLERGVAALPEGQARTEQGALVEQTRADLEALRRTPPAKTPGTFSWQLVHLTPALTPAPAVEALQLEFNRQLAEINRRNAKELPSLAPGQSGFAGAQACGTCHEPELRQWSATPHARAFEQLVSRGKEFDDDCVGCHVTGYRKAGGSNLGHVGELGGVGCEACHGPASLHAGTPDETEMPPAAVEAATCRSCHNARHSPNFDYTKYLPRVLGPGHEHQPPAVGDRR